MTKNKNNYKDSGVDIGQGQKFVEDIKKLLLNHNILSLLVVSEVFLDTLKHQAGMSIQFML